jgi:predicted DCC family thiol-disulfide oxidoreductase YuxK
LRLDRRDRFRYAPLQSAFAAELLTKHGINAADLNSVTLVANYGLASERAYSKSDAIFVSAREIGGIWRLGELARVLPKGARDGLYDLIARNRYQIFGRYDVCPIPDPERRSKFVEF